MQAVTNPTAHSITTAPAIAECFDCGITGGPLQLHTTSMGESVLLCIEREPCERRQLGDCDDCWTLQRRCWSCRFVSLAAFFNSDKPVNEYGEACDRCEGSGCDTCQPIRREHDRPYDFD